MDIEFNQDPISEDWSCKIVGLTEQECDVARNFSVASEALDAGAIGWGAQYLKNQDEFSATVRAKDKETAHEAAKAYYGAITEAVNEN